MEMRQTKIKTVERLVNLILRIRKIILKDTTHGACCQ